MTAERDFVLLLSLLALAAPRPSPDPLHVSLVRRSRHNVEDLPKALAKGSTTLFNRPRHVDN